MQTWLALRTGTIPPSNSVIKCLTLKDLTRSCPITINLGIEKTVRACRSQVLGLAACIIFANGCFGTTAPSGGDSDGNIDPATQCIQLADPPTGLASAKIGQIETGRFEPVFPLQDVYLIFGPQGGHHIDISMQFFAPDAGRWRHQVELVDSTNEEVVGHGEAVFDACSTGWSQTDYIRIHVMPTGWVDCRIEVTIDPIEGQSNARLRETVEIRVRSPQT